MNDIVNSCFEMVGGVFVLMNVIRLYRDKRVRGVSMIAVLFFVVWGYWNLYYYPSVHQWRSALGASSVAIVNTIWFIQMIYYTRKEKRNEVQTNLFRC